MQSFEHGFFTYYSEFEIHQCCSLCQLIIHFISDVIYHVDAPQHVYTFRNRKIFRLHLVFCDFLTKFLMIWQDFMWIHFHYLGQISKSENSGHMKWIIIFIKNFKTVLLMVALLSIHTSKVCYLKFQYLSDIGIIFLSFSKLKTV